MIRSRAIAAPLLALAGFVALREVGGLEDESLRLLTNVVWTLFSGGAALSCVAAARATRASSSRRIWALMGAGSAAWFGGMVAWDYLELVAGQVAPFPSLADVGYLLSAFLYLLAIIELGTHSRWVSLNIHRATCLGFVLAGLITVVPAVLFQPLRDTTLDDGALFLAIVYPVLYLLVFLYGCIVFWLNSWRGRRPVVGLLVLAMGFNGIPAVFYARALLVGNYQTGVWIDYLWLLAFVFIHWAARTCVALEQGKRLARRPPTTAPPFGEVVIPALTAVVTVAALGASGAVSPPFDVLLMVSALGFGGLLALRDWSLARVNDALDASRRQAEDERGEIERQLFHLQKMEALGTLAGGIAHDLNNMLQPIGSAVQLASRKLPADSPVQRHLAIIGTSNARASALVRQILDFSRDQRRSGDIGLCSLRQVIEESVALLRASVPAHVAIQTRCEPVPPVLADCGQIGQVLMNLGSNAAKAVEANGGRTITFRLDRSDSAPWVRLVVSDDGCGMEESARNRIFEPYFTTRKVGEGSGLGMAIVRGIVIRHGGTIEVESAPGLGTSVTIRLPLPGSGAACVFS